MRFWPKSKDRGWYGPWDLMEDSSKLPKNIGKGLAKIPGVQSVASWAKDRGEDVEESRVGSAILSTSPSVGVSYGDAGLQGQAGLNRAQGGPSVNFGQGQGGQGGQENQGRDWGGTLMSLLPILAQAGGSYLQYGREEKDRERMAKAAQSANIANLWAGKPIVSPQFTPSKVSGWEKLAKVGGQALQLGQQQRAQAEQAKLRDLQMQQVQGQLADAATARQAQQRAAGEERIRQEARGESAREALRGAGLTPFGEQTELTTSMGGRQPGPPVSRGYTPREVDIRDIASAEELRANKLYDLQVRAQEAGVELAEVNLAAQKRLAELPNIDMLLKTAKSYGTISPDLTKEAFLSLPSVINSGEGQPFTPEDEEALWAAYQVAAQKRVGEINKKDQERIDIFSKNLGSQKAVQLRVDYQRAMDAIIAGIDSKSGFGDIQMLKMLARLQDPGGVVKEAEYKTMEDAAPLIERVQLMTTGDRWIKGNRLTPEGRARVLALAIEAYENTKADIDSIANRFIAAEIARPGMENKEQMFIIASNPHRLLEYGEDKLMEAYKTVGVNSRAELTAFGADLEPDLVPVAEPRGSWWDSWFGPGSAENPGAEREAQRLEEIITQTGGRPTFGTTNILPVLSRLNIYGTE